MVVGVEAFLHTRVDAPFAHQDKRNLSKTTLRPYFPFLDSPFTTLTRLIPIHSPHMTVILDLHGPAHAKHTLT